MILVRIDCNNGVQRSCDQWNCGLTLDNIFLLSSSLIFGGISGNSAFVILVPEDHHQDGSQELKYTKYTDHLLGMHKAVYAVL